MPPSQEQPDDQNLAESLRQAADQHVQQILGRRQAARESRAAALALHPKPVVFKTELVRPAVAGDVADPQAVAADTSITQSAGYLLALGDSWFDYPIRDVLTNLDDHFGYNIESAAHKGDMIETMVSHVGSLISSVEILTRSFPLEQRLKLS